MKLSDFNRDRELEFYVDEDGKESTKIIEPVKEGKVKFHSISKELLDKLNSIDIKKEREYDGLIYKIMDILTDIKKDVPQEGFKSMLSYPPNNAFISYIDAINKQFIDLMDRYSKFKDNINKVNEQINKNINKLPEDMKKEFRMAQLTPEELLENLKNKYDEEKDPKVRDEMLDKMTDLKITIKNKK
ncbi:hypothetical protein ACSVC9_12045 [Clostridium sp. LBM24168]